jgi:hypothetical protein
VVVLVVLVPQAQMAARVVVVVLFQPIPVLGLLVKETMVAAEPYLVVVVAGVHLLLVKVKLVVMALLIPSGLQHLLPMLAAGAVRLTAMLGPGALLMVITAYHLTTVHLIRVAVLVVCGDFRPTQVLVAVVLSLSDTFNHPLQVYPQQVRLALSRLPPQSTYL